MAGVAAVLLCRMGQQDSGEVLGALAELLLHLDEADTKACENTPEERGPGSISYRGCA